MSWREQGVNKAWCFLPWMQSWYADSQRYEYAIEDTNTQLISCFDFGPFFTWMPTAEACKAADRAAAGSRTKSHRPTACQTLAPTGPQRPSADHYLGFSKEKHDKIIQNELNRVSLSTSFLEINKRATQKTNAECTIDTRVWISKQRAPTPEWWPPSDTNEVRMGLFISLHFTLDTNSHLFLSVSTSI